MLSWFSVKSPAIIEVQQPHPIVSQVVCLHNICKVDGSLTDTSHYSGCQWVWRDTLGQLQLMDTRTK